MGRNYRVARVLDAAPSDVGKAVGMLTFPALIFDSRAELGRPSDPNRVGYATIAALLMSAIDVLDALSWGYRRDETVVSMPSVNKGVALKLLGRAAQVLWEIVQSSQDVPHLPDYLSTDLLRINEAIEFVDGWESALEEIEGERV